MSYDLVTLGRVNMDLYSRDVGAEFEDVTSFDAMVGGSPSNIAIGTSRLGLRSVVLTAVGDDRVGDYVLRYFRDEGVVTDFIPRKPGKLTSLALLGVQPPDHFPLSFYRDDPADIHLTVDDVVAVPFDSVRALQLSGDALGRGTTAEAARYAGEVARSLGLLTFMDLDLRPTTWTQPAAYGLTMRSIMSLVDVVIGTEEEFYAALMPDPSAIMAGHAVAADRISELEDRVRGLLDLGPGAVAFKRGPRGVTLITADGEHEVPGFPVDVVNTVGAGDAFASGLIWSRLSGWDWDRSARFANACGAIEVTRHGCAVALPTYPEVMEFAESRGGL